MSYVSLGNLKKTIEKEKDFSLAVRCEVPNFNEEGGVAINFLEEPPKEGQNILLHFNPRPPAKHIVLNTFKGGKWGKEVILVTEDVRRELFERIFVLSIKVLSHSDKDGSEVLVFLNKKLQTTYRCPLDITKAKFIGFSPALRIEASEKDFQ